MDLQTHTVGHAHWQGNPIYRHDQPKHRVVSRARQNKYVRKFANKRKLCESNIQETEDHIFYL